MNKYNQFAGRLAFGADMLKFKRAVSMTVTGATPEDIWSATGFFKDLDGRWKWEIPDSNAKLIDGWRDKLSNNKSLHLSEILDHSLLYDNYPHLQRINVLLSDIGSATGSYSWHKNLISFSKSSFDTKTDTDYFKTLCHEIGHAIQYLEGFGYGTNTTPQAKQQYISAVEKYSSSIQNQINEWKWESHYSVGVKYEKVIKTLSDIKVYKARNQLAHYAMDPTPTRHYAKINKEIESILRNANKIDTFTRDINYLYMLVPKSNYNGKRADAIRELAGSAIRYANEHLSTSEEIECDSIPDLDALEMGLLTELIEINELRDDLFEMKESKKKTLEAMSFTTEMDPYLFYHFSSGEVAARLIANRSSISADKLSLQYPINEYDAPRHLVYAHRLDENGSILLDVDSKSDYQLLESNAFIEFGGDSFAHMILTPSADVSSIVHESAHYYLEIFSSLNLRKDVSSELKDDFMTIIDWMGVSEKEWYSLDDASKEVYHERFAEAFESWMLHEDHHHLVGVFEKLKKWMSEIFCATHNIPLTSHNGLDELFNKMAKGGDTRPTTIFDKQMYNAINQDLSAEVADATKRLTDRSLAYFEKVSGVQRNELGKTFDLKIDSIKPEKPKLVNTKH